MKIVIGEYYRHHATPKYGWAKALEKIKPKTGVNTHTYTIVKCEWTVGKGGTFGLIKYFRLCDLIRPSSN
ncbi:hypothetical protein LCGC14_1380010 [marine sediment metagenome]|uniref:Uncharacterized protein n=1 Tax=marine sediment metagenome TaxID=412755 RepID=A0A0F9MIA7_9ZZZZ